MFRAPLRRVGLVLLAVVTATAGLAAPAYAAPTGSIVGRLTGSNTPAANVQVTVQSVDQGSFGWAYTDAVGDYSVGGLEPGEYRVSFSPNGAPTQYVPGVYNPSDADLVTVAEGGVVTVNETLVPTGTLTGRLTDRTGNPMPHVWMSARPVNTNDYKPIVGFSTDVTGVFALRVAPGDYVVSFQVGSGASLFVPGVTKQSAATVFTVAVGQVVTADSTVAPSGTVSGQYLHADGSPVVNGQVVAMPLDDEVGSAMASITNGRYQIRDLPVGSYRLAMYEHGPQGYWLQFAYGTIDPTLAAVIIVTENSNSVVNDTVLGRGSVRVTAKDAVTGQPVMNYFSSLGERYGQSENSVALVDQVTAGSYQMYTYAEGYKANHTSVTVTAGQQIDAVVTLQPLGRIETTVVDALTGAPVPGICVTAQQPQSFRLGEGCYLSDETGKVTVYTNDPGTYQLFALPKESVYGAQWVGVSKGSGRQTDAKLLTVTSGAVTAGPTIRLDKAGVITGRVLNQNGSVPQYGYVAVGQEPWGLGGGGGIVGLDAEGDFTINFLGPYKWPLLFGGGKNAFQWSGGVANRFLAAGVSVTSGASTTYNYTMKPGTAVTITMPTGTNEQSLKLYNAITGDYAGASWFSTPGSTETFQVLGPQVVKVQIDDGPGSSWIGGTDFASADPFLIPASGSKTFALTEGSGPGGV
jgi:hypothetical protein